ncbi:MAG: FtsX-like permease family protein, partial [Verrucomicrobia bacterium]|nr:FtsX-like permease family protein [Verrucomicrobiota bacterium]
TLLLVALGLGSFLLLTLQLTRDTLLRQLFPETPSGRPNAILFDIQPDQRDGVISTLRRLGLPVLDEAPIVTMRLSEVKGRSMESLAKEPQGQRNGAPRREAGGGVPEWVLRREYRTTWRTNLNETETLVAGVWTPMVQAEPEAGQPIPISLEARIAEDLQVTLGDPIVWDVQGVPLKTVVGSLRRVDWRQVRPNFFVLFPGGALEAAPAMHLIATRVGSPEESARMQQALVREFPNVSAMDLTLILQTLDRVLTQVGLVVRFMALFTVATGLIVLAGAVLAGRWQRVQESILLRTLGASRGQIRSILMAEYIALGTLAGLLAGILAVASSWSLARFAFQSDYVLSWTPLLLTLVAVPVLTLLVGLATSRGIADQPPLEILRREG